MSSWSMFGGGGGDFLFCSKSGGKPRIDNNGSAFVPDDTVRYEIIHYYCRGDKSEMTFIPVNRTVLSQ